MEIPFETHIIYITLDDEKMYQLNSDYSKTKVNSNEVLTVEAINNCRKKPFMLIHKEQFLYGKELLMNKLNPESISHESAEIYHKIGFITKEELKDYIKN